MTENDFRKLFGDDDYEIWKRASKLLNEGKITYEEYCEMVGNSVLEITF